MSLILKPSIHLHLSNYCSMLLLQLCLKCFELNLLNLFSSVLFPWLYQSTDIVVKLSLVVLNSLNFTLSEKLFILPLLDRILAAIAVILIVKIFQHSAWDVSAFPSGLQSFNWRMAVKVYGVSLISHLWLLPFPLNKSFFAVSLCYSVVFKHTL